MQFLVKILYPFSRKRRRALHSKWPMAVHLLDSIANQGMKIQPNLGGIALPLTGSQLGGISMFTKGLSGPVCGMYSF